MKDGWWEGVNGMEGKGRKESREVRKGVKKGKEG